MRRALVFVGGDLGDIVASDLPASDFVLAADSGLHNARALGIAVDGLIGDLDSVDPDAIGDIPVLRHPADKDASDTELAIDHAIANGATDVVLVGGLGGRLDHLIAIALGMCRFEWADTRMSAIMGRSRLYVVRTSISIDGTPGEYISQFAMNGPIRGLRVSGLRWSGHYPIVDFGSTFCLSDEFATSRCHLSIEGGVMLVVHELGERVGAGREPS